MEIWQEVVDLHSGAFRDQSAGTMVFRGTSQTDGIGVSVVVKQNRDAAKGGSKRKQKKSSENEPYIHERDE